MRVITSYSIHYTKLYEIKKIYQALCAAAGINVIFDPQLKDDKFTLDLRNLTFQT